MRIYWIKPIQKGNLGMMPRPKGNDWLEDEIKKLKIHKVNTVVSLLEYHEIKSLELENEEQLCTKHNIQYINHSIPDRGIPEKTVFLKLISDIDTLLKSDKNVVIHCRMGIGRTAMLAAGILIKNGKPPHTVFDFLSEVRTLEVPDTEMQKQWIQELDVSSLI